MLWPGAFLSAGFCPDPRSIPGSGECSEASTEHRRRLLFRRAGCFRCRAAPAYSMENPENGSHAQAVSSFSAWRLQVVCYGPQALENARKIRAFLYLDGSGFPRSILRKAGLYPVPNPPEPLLLHEPEGSLWRRRADLTISLRAEETQTHPARRNAITSAPAVIIPGAT